MTAKNDITGDALVSKAPTDAYREGWDAIFGKKPLEGEVIAANKKPKGSSWHWPTCCQAQADAAKDVTNEP